MSRRLLFVVLVLACGSSTLAEALPIIPGAFGYGMDTRAAYGLAPTTQPTVCRVTALTDSGASGELRACLEASGPRIVVFEVSGTIALTTDIQVMNPYVTIAGQTAPSPGITVKGFGIQMYTHDVLMQHMRIRAGDGPPLIPQTQDHDATVAYNGGYNVVFDHNSFSWSQGKNTDIISVASGAGVTYWQNINSEALYQGANVIIDPGQPSSLGLLLAQSYVNVPAFMTVYGNLLAHNSDRNPEIQGPVRALIANNVIYDWGKDSTDYQWATFHYNNGLSNPPIVAIVGNKYIAGPPPSPFTPLYAIGTYNADANAKFYVSDIALDGSKQTLVQFYFTGRDPRVSTLPAEISLSGITLMSSSLVEDFVLAHAGARPADRDSVDTRIVNETALRTGGVIMSQTAVGGWPTLAVNHRSLTLPANPHVDSGNGYTNLEVWLQGYASGVESGVSPPPPVTSLGIPLMPKWWRRL